MCKLSQVRKPYIQNLFPFYDRIKKRYYLEANFVRPLSRTKQDWRKHLGPTRYDVMRNYVHAAPFSQKMINYPLRRKFHFTCAACNLPVYHGDDISVAESLGWMNFHTCIENSVSLEPTKLTFEDSNRSRNIHRPLSNREKYFAALNGGSDVALNLRCKVIDNAPFAIPAMGRKSSITKDGLRKPMYIACSCCKSFLGEFHSAVSRESLKEGRTVTGKHVVFPICVKLVVGNSN